MSRSALIAMAWLTALSGCEEPPARNSAPPAVRATFALEPPRIEIGTVATLDLLVVTPPNHTVAPYDGPGEVAGFWILDVQREPVTRDPGRWVHRTRLRIRAREVGSFEWPAALLRVEGPDATPRELTASAIPLEVASMLGQFPEQSTPFGARRADTAESAGGRAGPAAAGALAALLAVAAFAAIRRGSRRARHRPPAPIASSAPWTRGRESIADLRAMADQDPLSAAHGLSATLRGYMARRFGADAESRTTEELASATPPFAASSRWPEFVALLRDLDAVRFRPEGDAETRRGSAERVSAACDAAAAFVESTVPPEARR